MYSTYYLGRRPSLKKHVSKGASRSRSFLLKCTNGPLLGVETGELQLLCDEYEHARHHHRRFGEQELEVRTTRAEHLVRVETYIQDFCLDVHLSHFASTRAPHVQSRPEAAPLAHAPEVAAAREAATAAAQSAAAKRRPEVQRGQGTIFCLLH